MNPFELISVALSFVLGLAVTLLLSSFLNAFRARHKTRMSWLPLTWATYVLILQFSQWWAIYDLSSLETWSVGAFGLLLFLELSLFAAGALVLPAGTDDYPSDLRQYFEEDGRWGVGMVVVFQMIANLINVTLTDDSIFSTLNLLNTAGLVFAAMVAVTKQPAIAATGTVLYGVCFGVYLLTFLPRTH